MTSGAIPFNRLQPQHEALAAPLREAVDRVLTRGWFVLGDEVAAFERAYAAHLGVSHVVGVANGTEAITLMLRALDIGQGDEVILPAHTCPATAAGIAASGAALVPADIDDATLTLCPESTARAITPRTRAILAVHLYGYPADMDALRVALMNRPIALLEDAAQAHGVRYKGCPAGTLGHAAAFSFYPTKNLGACGDAGAVATDDDVLADRVRMLRNYGEKSRYVCETAGINSRLDEMQAAILEVKLPFLEQWNEARRVRAEAYRQALADLPLQLPPQSSTAQSNNHLFVIRTRQRDHLAAHLADDNIGTQVHYPLPIHLHPAFRSLGYAAGRFPVSEQAAHQVLSLPCYPELPLEDVQRVSDSIRKFFGMQ